MFNCDVTVKYQCGDLHPDIDTFDLISPFVEFDGARVAQSFIFFSFFIPRNIYHPGPKLAPNLSSRTSACIDVKKNEIIINYF